MEGGTEEAYVHRRLSWLPLVGEYRSVWLPPDSCHKTGEISGVSSVCLRWFLLQLLLLSLLNLS